MLLLPPLQTASSCLRLKVSAPQSCIPGYCTACLQVPCVFTANMQRLQSGRLLGIVCRCCHCEELCCCRSAQRPPAELAGAACSAEGAVGVGPCPLAGPAHLHRTSASSHQGALLPQVSWHIRIINLIKQLCKRHGYWSVCIALMYVWLAPWHMVVVAQCI